MTKNIFFCVKMHIYQIHCVRTWHVPTVNSTIHHAQPYVMHSAIKVYVLMTLIHDYNTLQWKWIQMSI